MDLARALALTAALSTCASGCYQSHELPLCSSDIPLEERCLEPPPGVPPGDLVWTGGSFLHRDPRAGCIAVSVDPAMVDDRELLEDAIATVAALECSSLCFEDVEVVATDALPPGPRVHLAPDGACVGAGPGGTACFADVDLCRGTFTLAVLALSEPSGFSGWRPALLTATIVGTLGLGQLTLDEVSGRLSPRVRAHLCAMYSREDHWCPGS